MDMEDTLPSLKQSPAKLCDVRLERKKKEERERAHERENFQLHPSKLDLTRRISVCTALKLQSAGWGGGKWTGEVNGAWQEHGDCQHLSCPVPSCHALF